MSLPYKKRQNFLKTQEHDQAPVDDVMPEPEEHDQAPVDDVMPEPEGHDQNPVDVMPEPNARSARPHTRIGERWQGLLFEKQMETDDINGDHLTIPLKTADPYFPPHIKHLDTTPILISDAQNKDWPLTLLKLNNTIRSTYWITKGWPKFVEAHNLEVKDMLGFFNPVKPSQKYQYHFLVKCIKAKETESSNVSHSAEKHHGNEDDSKNKGGDHGGPSPTSLSYRASMGIVIGGNEKPTPPDQQKNQGKNSEDNSMKQGDHGGPISPPGSHKGAKATVTGRNKKPTPPVLDEKNKAKNNEDDGKKYGSKKQGGGHGEQISPTCSYKEAKAVVTGRNENLQPKKKRKGGVLNSTVSTKTDIIIDGYELNYLFQVQLTRNQLANKLVRIPAKEAEVHFPPMKKPDGNYKAEEGILVSDPGFKKRRMKFKYSEVCKEYMIAGSWCEFIATHKLQASDVIRIFKVAKPAPVRHYFIDYVRAEEAAGATVTQSCRPGKDGCRDMDDSGDGSSKKHGHGGSGLGAGNQEPAPVQ